MSQRPAVTSLSIAAVYVGFALVGLPIVMLGPGRAFALSLPVAGAWCVILYSALRLTVKGARGQSAPISMTFWLFVYVFFGVTPLIQIVDSLGSTYSEALLGASFGVVLLGCAMFDVGATFIGPLRSSGIVTRKIFAYSELARGRAVILGIAALIATPFLISAYGGLDKLFLSRTERWEALVRATSDTESQVLTQIILALITTPIFVAFMALLVIYLHQRKSRDPNFKRVSLVTVVIIGLAAIVINNPISSPRWTVGVTVLSLLFFLGPWHKRATFSLSVLAISLLFIVVFPFADAFRNTIETDVVGNIKETSVQTEIVEKGDFDAFEQLVNVLAYVDQKGLGYGRQLTGTLLFWFPRSIWANKPIPSGPLVAEWRGTTNTNLSLPLWGELYLDGHVALVAVGMLLYGVFVGKVESQYLASAGDTRTPPTFATVFVPVFGAYQIFLLRGSLLGTIAQLVPFVLCMWFCTKRSAVVEVAKPRGDLNAANSFLMSGHLTRSAPRQ